MSNHTLVVGAILVPNGDLWSAALAINADAVAQLPQIDDYPYLSRSMFALTPREQSYGEHVWHFAATMKGVEEHWEEWVSKLENLLSSMCWLFVDVYLATENYGDHRYWWVSSGESFIDGQLVPVQGWERSEGPWSYAEFQNQSLASRGPSSAE